MDNVNFEAKTNWVQDETVYPADANRWEKGIKDCADLVNNHNTTQIPALENNNVNKSGDTMTGPLKMSGENEVRFGTDDNYYYIKNNWEGDLVIYNNNKGLFLQASEPHAPFYWNGTNAYRLLTTADLANIKLVAGKFKIVANPVPPEPTLEEQVAKLEAETGLTRVMREMVLAENSGASDYVKSKAQEIEDLAKELRTVDTPNNILTKDNIRDDSL